MVITLWRLTRGYRFCPWRSPYLHWRIETFWGMHAGKIRFRDFWKFVWEKRRDFVRYGRWARRMRLRHGAH